MKEQLEQSPEQKPERDPKPNPEKRPQRLDRLAVPALDEILGDTFPVLDDGFIRVIDYMGDDSAIVQAARVSYGSGTKKVTSSRRVPPMV